MPYRKTFSPKRGKWIEELTKMRLEYKFAIVATTALSVILLVAVMRELNVEIWNLGGLQLGYDENELSRVNPLGDHREISLEEHVTEKVEEEEEKEVLQPKETPPMELAKEIEQNLIDVEKEKEFQENLGGTDSVNSDDSQPLENNGNMLRGWLEHLRGKGLDGIVMVVGEDWGSADLIPNGKLARTGISLQGFRSSSPDTVESYAGLLSGRHPASINGNLSSSEWTNGDNKAVPTLYSVLHVQRDLCVGHFGRWPFHGVNLDNLVEKSVVTDDAVLAIAEAMAFVANCRKSGKKHYVNVWLPMQDVAFENEEQDSYWARKYNLASWMSSKSKICKDIVRGNSKNHRYKTCPRLVYMVNRIREETLIGNFLKRWSMDQTSTEAFIFTSTNGPESPQVYGHAYGRTHFRGQKRSLYDGGINVPFRFWLKSPLSFEQIRPLLIRKLRQWDARILFGGVDWFSTACKALLGKAFDLNSYTEQSDGEDFSEVIFGGTAPQPRRKPLLWAWNKPIPGHCTADSPGLAIMTNKNFKLLLEPIFENDGSVTIAREELFQVYSTLSSDQLFERNDEAKKPSKQDLKLSLRLRLLHWLDRLPLRIRERWYPHTGCKGVQDRLEKSFEHLSAEEIKNIKEKVTKRPSRPMGIIFMLSDDLGIGDVSVFNQNIQYNKWMSEHVAFEPNTPAIDSLASKGMIFTNFYSSSSVCSPTRAALMTGRYPFHKEVAVHWQIQRNPEKQQLLGVAPYLGSANPSSEHYLTKTLQKAGFVVGHFGKWHLGGMALGKSTGVLRPGANTGARLVSDNAYGISAYQVYSATKDRREPAGSHFEHDFCFASHIQTDIVDDAIDFIKKRVARNESYYLNLWFQNSHAPLNLATHYDQASKLGYPFRSNPFPHSKFSSLSESAKTFPNANVDQHLSLQIYRALVKDHDEQIGRLVNFVERQNLSKDTLIIYSSDNGPEYPGLYHASVGSSNPFRGGKRSLFEGGIRAPLILRWDGVIPTSKRHDMISSTMDLFPTILHLANIKPPSLDLDGISLFEKMETSSESERNLLFEFRGWAHGADCRSYTPRFAVRYKNYKTYLEPKDNASIQPREFQYFALFNVKEDPGEMNNLLKTHREQHKSLVAKMGRMLTSYFDSGRYDVQYFTPPVTRSRRRSFFSKCRELSKTAAIEMGQPFSI